MPESTVAKAHQDNSLTSKSKWVTPVIIVLVVGLFVISMVLGAKKTSGGEEGFGELTTLPPRPLRRPAPRSGSNRSSSRIPLKSSPVSSLSRQLWVLA